VVGHTYSRHRSIKSRLRLSGEGRCMAVLSCASTYPRLPCLRPGLQTSTLKSHAAGGVFDFPRALRTVSPVHPTPCHSTRHYRPTAGSQRSLHPPVRTLLADFLFHGRPSDTPYGAAGGTVVQRSACFVAVVEGRGQVRRRVPSYCCAYHQEEKGK
jgi:hypothetical protein